MPKAEEEFIREMNDAEEKAALYAKHVEIAQANVKEWQTILRNRSEDLALARGRVETLRIRGNREGWLPSQTTNQEQTDGRKEGGEANASAS